MGNLLKFAVVAGLILGMSSCEKEDHVERTDFDFKEYCHHCGEVVTGYDPGERDWNWFTELTVGGGQITGTKGPFVKVHITCLPCVEY